MGAGPRIGAGMLETGAGPGSDAQGLSASALSGVESLGT
jgi:hypothetical protein